MADPQKVALYLVPRLSPTHVCGNTGATVPCYLAAILSVVVCVTASQCDFDFT